MLTFDEAAHRYYWNGTPVPNVTSVLKDLVDYSKVPPAILETARMEGVAIHRMVELDAKNELVQFPDWMAPYYDALQKFKRETRFTVLHSERRVYHPNYGYAGTLDLEGTLHDEPAIVDVKRSLMAGPVIGLQIAAYAAAVDLDRKKPDRIKRRAALVLKKNGTYQLEPFDDRNDYAVFLSCLTRHTWKEKNA